MKFDFLSLWELSLQPNITYEQLQQFLIPTRRGILEHSLENFENLSLHNHSHTLIMLMGVPGAGKSTMAEKLNNHCTNIGLSSKIISVDDLISNYFMENILMIDFHIDLATLQFHLLQDAFNTASALYDVIILDGTFLSVSDRFVVLKTVSEYFSNIVGLFLDTNLDELKKVQSDRIFKRLSDEDFEYYLELANKVLQEEKILTVGFDVVYIIQR